MGIEDIVKNNIRIIEDIRCMMEDIKKRVGVLEKTYEELQQYSPHIQVLPNIRKDISDIKFQIGGIL